MNKQTLLAKLEDGVTSLRQMLEENDGSTLKTLKSSAKQGFESMKDAFTQNEKAQKAVADIKKHMEDFEQAVKNGDKDLSAKILDAAEKKIKEYKEKYCKDEEPKQVESPKK
ncbi:MAG: hypothetical protein DELT_01291 [Desulfovibrio sp.]